MNIKDVLLSLHERPVAFYPIYARKTGSLTCGVLLSQLLHWNTAMKGQSFFKTDAEIREETALSIDELKAAKGKLKAFDFVEIKAKGVPAKTWYTFDLVKLAEWISTNQLAEIPPTEKRETHQQESDNSTSSMEGNPPTLHRVPENTQREIYKEEPKPNLPPAELKVMEALLKAEKYFQQWPDQQQMMCERAKRSDALHPKVFRDTLEAWIRYNIDNPAIIQNIETSITKSFQAWLTRNLEANNKPKNGLFRPAGQEAAAPAYKAPVNQKLQF
jgi:hypothetical protein